MLALGGAQEHPRCLTDTGLIQTNRRPGEAEDQPLGAVTWAECVLVGGRGGVR